MKESTEIQKNQIWFNFDNEFVVEDYKKINDQYWVFYQNTRTKINYSCLEEAFRARFSLVVNRG